VTGGPGEAQVIVHPNNPDGHLWQPDKLPLRVIDESFCDVSPQHSLISLASEANALVLKSFGKFWRLAGLRLGFTIGDPEHIAQLRDKLGPWPVAGPALHIGAAALNDREWADEARTRLTRDSARLDKLMRAAGADPVGGTTLFRLYRVDDAKAWQARLADRHIWSRVFPYNARWLRLGLPHPSGWSRLETALE
jgi:cobalamin biosynthesis protein CobC